jgi:hypothetical protein
MRTTLPLSTIAGQVQQAVVTMDPALPVIKLQTMEDVFSESTARPGFLAQLLGGFALLALVLAPSGPTASSRISSPSGGGRSASAWRSARTARGCSGW